MQNKDKKKSLFGKITSSFKLGAKKDNDPVLREEAPAAISSEMGDVNKQKDIKANCCGKMPGFSSLSSNTAFYELKTL